MMIVVKRKANHSVDVEAKKDLIIEVTNDKLVSWYENAKIDHGVIGAGEARFNGDKFEVLYTENGKKFLATYVICDEYIIDNDLDWLFKVWSELALDVVELN